MKAAVGRIAFIGLTLVLLSMVAVLPVRAQPSCARPASLSSSRAARGSSSTCYNFSVPKGQNVLLVTLEVTSGTFDLYVKEGKTRSLSVADRVTASDVGRRGTASYALLQPATGTFTVGVEKSGSGSGSFSLTATTAGTGRNMPSLSCSGSTCRASYPLGSTVSIGSVRDDQLVFPIAIGRTGRVVAGATRSKGTATSLSLSLYGPSKSSRDPSPGLYAGGSSSLSYDVSSSDLRRAGNWWISLSNDRGGTVSSGTVTITYPR